MITTDEIKAINDVEELEMMAEELKESIPKLRNEVDKVVTNSAIKEINKRINEINSKLPEPEVFTNKTAAPVADHVSNSGNNRGRIFTSNNSFKVIM